jgi:hypothetical protein
VGLPTLRSRLAGSLLFVICRETRALSRGKLPNRFGGSSLWLSLEVVGGACPIIRLIRGLSRSLRRDSDASNQVGEAFIGTQRVPERLNLGRRRDG